MSNSKTSSLRLWYSYMATFLNENNISADIVNKVPLSLLKRLYKSAHFSDEALLVLLEPQNTEKLDWAIKASVPLSSILIDKGTDEQLEKKYHLSKKQKDCDFFLRIIAEKRIGFYAYLIEKGEVSLNSFELKELISLQREDLLLKYIENDKFSHLPFQQAVEEHLFASKLETLKSAYTDALEDVVKTHTVPDNKLTVQTLTLIAKTTDFTTLKDAFSRCGLTEYECVQALIDANLPDLTARFIREDYFSGSYDRPQIISQLISSQHLEEFKKILTPDCLNAECEEALVNSGDETFIRAYIEAMKDNDFEGFDDSPRELFLQKCSEEIKAFYDDTFGLSYQQEYKLVHQGTAEMVRDYITKRRLYCFVEAFFVKAATSEELIEFYIDRYGLDTPAEIALMRYRSPRLIAYYCQKLLSVSLDEDFSKLSLQAWPYFLQRGDDKLIMELILFYRTVSSSLLPKDIEMLILETGRMSLIEDYCQHFEFSANALENFIKTGTPQAVKAFVSQTKLSPYLETSLVKRGDKEISLAYIRHFPICKEAALHILDIV